MSLNGQMNDTQLTISSIMGYAEQTFGNVEIISITADNPCHRYRYKDAFQRVRRLANAIAKFELPASTRVATLAWNDHRYFELYFALSCSGLVCHTINPRFMPDQIESIISHGEEQLLFLDPVFLPLIEAIHSKLPAIKQYVLLTDDVSMPASKLTNICSYEAFIRDESVQFTFSEPNDDAINSLCYGAGITKKPMALIYSHRESALHNMSNIMPNVLEFNNNNIVTPVLKLELLTSSPALGSKPMTVPDKSERIKLEQVISAFTLGVSHSQYI